MEPYHKGTGVCILEDDLFPICSVVSEVSNHTEFFTGVHAISSFALSGYPWEDFGF